MRRYIQMIMIRWDCELAIEPTAEGAIRRAATFKPDVALLGLTPGMERAQAGIGLLRISPGTEIVLWNEPVPTHVLSDLSAGIRLSDACRAVRRTEIVGLVLFGPSPNGISELLGDLRMMPPQIPYPGRYPEHRDADRLSARERGRRFCAELAAQRGRGRLGRFRGGGGLCDHPSNRVGSLSVQPQPV